MQPLKVTQPPPLNTGDVATVVDRLLSTKSVLAILDLESDRTLRSLIATGNFPPADLRLGRRLRWKFSTVMTAINGGNGPPG